MQVREGGAGLPDLHVVLLHHGHRLRQVQVHRPEPAPPDDRHLREYNALMIFNAEESEALKYCRTESAFL